MPESNSEQKSNIFLRVFMLWSVPLIFKAFRTKKLEKEDLFSIRSDVQFEAIIGPYQRNAAKHPKDGPLKVIVRTFKWYLVSIAILSLISSMAYSIPPILVKRIILLIESPDSNERSMLAVLGIYFLLNLVNMLCTAHSTLVTNRFSTIARQLLRRLLFEKIFRIHPNYGSAGIAAKVNNMVNMDIMTIVFFLLSINQAIGAPLRLLFTMAIIVYQIKWIGVVALAFICTLVMIQSTFRHTLQMTFRQKMAKTDEYNKTLSEFFAKIKVVKLNCWENLVMKKLEPIRNQICKQLKLGAALWAILNIISYNTPALTSVIVFVLFAFTGNSISPAEAFPMMMLLQNLLSPLMTLVSLFQTFLNFEVSYSRYSWFMNAVEKVEYGECPPDLEKGYAEIKDGEFSWLDENVRVSEEEFEQLKGKKSKSIFGWICGCFGWLLCCRCLRRKKKPKTGLEEKLILDPTRQSMGIEIEEVSKFSKFHEKAEKKKTSMEPITEVYPNLEESKESPVTKYDSVLYNINVKVLPGEMVGIIGRVGAGKSSLLSAFMSEVNKLKGRVILTGKPSVCQQEPWLMNGTIRDNILFGEVYDEEKYQEALELCQLGPDIETFPGKDLTEIGERGVNLSGGQKQRVAIARAIYQSGDIYLMDDVFSALDVHIGALIFEAVIMGKLAKKTRIMSLNTSQYLKYFKRILVVKNGRIVSEGDPKELLMNKDPALMEGLVEIEHQEQEKEIQMKRKPSVKAEKMPKGPPLAHVKESGPPLKEVPRKDPELEQPNVSLNPSPVLGPREQQARLADDRNRKKGLLTVAEMKKTGEISAQVYWKYLKQTNICIILLYLVIICTGPCIGLFTDVWLAYWSGNKLGWNNQLNYAFIYTGSVAAMAFQSATLDLFTRWASLLIANKMHYTMIRSLLRTRLYWFDLNPLGRIINRCVKDQSDIDSSVPVNFKLMLKMTIKLLVTIAYVAISILFILPIIMVMFVLYWIIVKLNIRAKVEGQRWLSISRSPTLSFTGETASGYIVVRSFGKVPMFSEMYQKLMVTFERALYTSNISDAFLNFQYSFLGAIVAVTTCYIAYITRPSDIDPAQTAIISLCITYMLELCNMISYISQQFTSLEGSMNAVERVQEYMEDTPQEPEYENPPPRPGFMKEGLIEFKNFGCRYREELPLVLENLSFKIMPGEKIGIVGKTGCGKSTLTLALTRVIEPANANSFFVDGQNVQAMGVKYLRENITMIPQEPTLFKDTIRNNVDPFQDFSDQEVETILRKTKIWDDLIRDDPSQSKLDFVIKEGGSNLSVGQKQLVSLARALLRRRKIVIMDEATASLDEKSDQIVQTLVREDFKDSCVITIAHRIKTIMDYDRIFVIQKGRLVEEGNPKTLLQREGSIFKGMVDKMTEKEKEKQKEKTE